MKPAENLFVVGEMTALLFDGSGNPISSIVDGADRRLLVKPPTQQNVDITNWIGSASPTVGQKAMTASLPVVVASDQSSIPVLAEGKYASGTINTPLPMVLGGVGTDGTIRYILVDSTGRIVVTEVSGTEKVVTINYEAAYNVAGAFANYWFKGVHYTVPAAYQYEVSAYMGWSDDNRCSARVNKFIVMGGFNVGTNVFTDGSAYSSPEFASHLDLEVTTAFGNLAGVTFTITYTNQDGVAGRTGTAIVGKQAWPIGIKIPITLQSGDYGVRDVTNVSRVGAETGIVNVNGSVSLWRVRMTAAGTTYWDSISHGHIVKTAEVMGLDFLSNAAANVARSVRVTGFLMPV